MIGFEQIVILTVATITTTGNGTATELAGDAFLTSINSFIGSITALIIAVSGIVVAIITQRSQGRQKTKQEESIVGGAEAIQLVMQKLKEQQAQIGAVGKATLSLATTDEQRKRLDTEVAPVVNTTAERIEVINEQIPAVKEIIGVKQANVNQRKMPRESDKTLKVINDTVAKQSNPI